MPAPGEAEQLAPVADLLRRTWSAGEVRVLAAERLSGGASRVTWALDVLVDGERVVPLVLQQRRAGAVGAGLLALEERLLRVAARGGVPVPDVVAADPDGDLLGAPFLVTARVEGETIPRRVLRAPELAAARDRFAADCGRVLAAVHALPLEELPGLPRPDPLAELVGHLDDALGASPAFELALLWLADTRPPAVRPAVVHGDFRTGNLLLQPAGLTAVLDWELAHLGDPAEDLGWLCVRSWRFGGPQPVGGMGTREDLLTAYAAAGGAELDPAGVFWWEVLGTLRWGVMCHLQARAHLDGHSRSVELAVIGRRVAENEYDLLRMLP
ncbi:MAG TPA: phosphotransferase family protein [Mycobacteriales bacterium]|nr:phosphotransferase family protein [Mycobacteriales bacterium]